MLAAQASCLHPVILLPVLSQDAAGWLQHNQQQQQGQGSDQQQQPVVVVQHPRYARVNTLKASMQEVLAQLQAEPSSQAAAAGGNNADNTNNTNKSSSSRQSGGGYADVVAVDGLLPDLLVFPPGTDLHDHPLVEEGVLILQVGGGAV